MKLKFMETREINKKNRKKKGFTLIEMVVVIAIIAIIAGIAIPQALKAINKSKVTSDIANAKSIASAISQGIGEGETLHETQTASGTDTKAADVWKKVHNTNIGDWLNTYMANVPEVKKDNKKMFYYTYDGATLKIGVGLKTGDTLLDAGIIELYPTLNAGY